MNLYVFVLHERPADYIDISPAQMQEGIARYGARAAGLARRGLLVGGQKLATDGPYAATHEVVGGCFVVQAESYVRAEELAQT